MENKEQQVKNSFIYLLPVLVGNLIPIITLPIYTRILSKEDFGALALAQVFASFLNGLGNFGLLVVYERNFFQYRNSKQEAALLYSSLFFVLSTFIIFGSLAFIFKTTISNHLIGTPGYANFIFWNYCAAGFMSLKMYYLTYFKNTENASSYVWYTIDENIIGFLVSLLLVAVVKVGIIGIPYGQVIASLIVFFLLNIKFLKMYPVTFDRFVLWDALKTSFPLTPKLILSVIGNQSDKYILGLVGTIGGVGIYSIGQRVANMGYVYMTAIQNVFSPQVYKRMFGSGDRGGVEVGKYLTPFAYISVAVVLLIVLFSEEVIMILTPKSYYGAEDIIVILSIYYSFLFFGKQPQLLFAKKTFVTSLLSLVGIVSSVVVSVPFIKSFGTIGAAWAALIGGMISSGISFRASQYYYKIYWEYRKLAGIYGIFLISSGLALSHWRDHRRILNARLLLKRAVERSS